MKKSLGLLLALIMVLSIGTIAFAVEGTLANNNELTANIGVNATVGPYASLRIGATGVEFGTLLGKVGLYTANSFDGTETEFYQRAALIFGDDELPLISNNKGWAAFYIESNTDVNIAIAFDGTKWLNSPTLFAVSKSGFPQDALAWASANYNLPTGTQTSFTHNYQVGELLYGVDGAIWIQNISQQYAKDYSGTVTLTVSK